VTVAETTVTVAGTVAVTTMTVTGTTDCDSNNNNLRSLESTNTEVYTINKLPRRTAQVQVPARRPGITTTGFSTGKKLPHDGAKRLY